ncbi:putative Zn(2)-C6 fungal-type domain-containing protein [Seiridium cardinale]|uniref:Zn(2)-C6 fungal-type domain-containing protein n=1 Tax=Seiridium cardinale TaxID=138064 RepID=A0ABR2XLV7_9PEZI
MMPHSPPTPNPHPHKRARQTSPDRDSPNSGPSAVGAGSPTTIETPIEGLGPQNSKVGQSSNFRNVSACNRCRLRKNRCDQNLPSCASCEKAKVACVGYDPITKKEIPRSYVYYLETRVGQLEALLKANNLQFPPAEDLEYCSRSGVEGVADTSPKTGSYQASPSTSNRPGPSRSHHNGDEQARSNKVVRHGLGSGGRSLGSTNGISFARVVYAAVQSTVSDHKSHSERGGVKPYTKSVAGNGAAASGTSMRDSFFGLHTKPTINPAQFPDRDLALHLVNIYFEHANPQIPVLHRVEFMQMFELAFADEGRIRGPRELYMLNMVFAIGKGIFQTASSKNSEGPRMPREAQPEEYHASAIVHLEACLSSSGGGLDELQAVLLLANFALLRPVPPGLWYIVGVAVRLAVDLGLYLEDGKELPNIPDADPTVDPQLQDAHTRHRGRREYVRDLRRRLWWCTYSLDRLVSTCVGRPFGVSDQVVTTEFPTLLEDRYITPSGFTRQISPNEPTYKVVAYHYFRLRLLQSEVLQVLQFQQTQLARAGGQNRHNVYMHTQLPSPFLNRFDSFRSWRMDIDRRLYEWKNSSPNSEESGVEFSTEFFDLNYWQAVILLYRQSLEVPEMFEGEYNTSKEVNSPSLYPPETGGDEERVYMKVAEAGQKIIRIYRQLHVMGLVNFTYLATHHLFMAGISYLYAIWHSPLVRSRLSMDEVDFTILAATSVFTDLIEKCPPAEACRDAFERTAKATVKMAKQTGGFGQAPVRANSGRSNNDYLTARDASGNRQRHHQQRISMDQSGPRSSHSQYDMGVADAYSSNHRTSQVPPIQTNPFPLNMPNIKTERDGYSMIRGMPGSRNTTSSIPEEPDNSAIDPSLLPSPGAAQQTGQSPLSVTSMTPASVNAASSTTGVNYMRSPTAMNTPGQLSYSGLQEMEFLQGLQGNTGMEGDMIGEGQLDLSGLGFGFEGMHHDFNDGQQVDLLDGFWFGGQQNGGGGAM